jgi:hypothetical protein
MDMSIVPLFLFTFWANCYALHMKYFLYKKSQLNIRFLIVCHHTSKSHMGAKMHFQLPLFDD